MLKVHTPPDIFKPIGPYAQAIEATSVERLLFISGTMGLEPDGRLAGDFEAQATRVWSNIDATLKAAGMERTNLAKLTIWLADREDWRLGAEIRQRYLGDHKVAMSVVQAGLVDSSWLIEVDAIAVA
ncbi:RidA family protein [Variovorax beijingensis]|uniref:RidA family protein n=1 Tax=Variovorax beijingensis TaxID=2496117 RepID=A0A3P3E299_9BURK|nr:RidA family protein [Variovorax beijingensis]RRH80394.1 RidA family protein [Variovorax beijingensis]